MLAIGQEHIRKRKNYGGQGDFDDAAKRYKPAARSLPNEADTQHQDIQAALQTYYEPYLTIQRVSGDTLSLDSCYINLAIIEATDQRQKDKEDLKAQAAAFHRIPSYEEISETNMKASIPLEELFDKRF
ncbi:hypothetical protein BGZ79_004658 [Entomortierella chlamydospora]|nr:hypothetical protein BGZ79_004658 [Entomortierella chlamydospora]